MSYTFYYDKVMGVGCFIRSDGKQSLWITGQEALEILAMQTEEQITYAESLDYD